jgi:hypothetical protein
LNRIPNFIQARSLFNQQPCLIKKISVGNVIALVDTLREVNVQLEVGMVTEAVTVTTTNEAPINPTDASLGNAFENKRVVELPLNARNIVGLLSLQAGVTRQGEVTGGRCDQANNTIDGIDTNEQQTGLDVVAPAGAALLCVGCGVEQELPPGVRRGPPVAVPLGGLQRDQHAAVRRHRRPVAATGPLRRNCAVG